MKTIGTESMRINGQLPISNGEPLNKLDGKPKYIKKDKWRIIDEYFRKT